MLKLARARRRGFTLVELMIGIAVLAILVMAAAPSLQLWVINTRVRTAAEAMQNGLRRAQTEAARQGRQVVFSRVSTAPAANAAPDAAGNNWSAQLVAIATIDNDPNRTLPDGVTPAGPRELFVAGGPMADVASGVTIEAVTGIDAAPASICFSSMGTLVANANPIPAVAGDACVAGAATYRIRHPSGDRPLWVRVSLNGRVRMCDPAKTLNASNPDGCQ